MTTLVEHARLELDLLGEEPSFAACLVATVAAFASYGHSGGSAEIAIEQLTKLLNREALTPLTGDPAEWEDRSAMSGTPIWQNNRDSRAMSVDGGLTYTLVGETYGLVLHHSEPPPWWIADLMAREAIERAAAADAVMVYLRAGPLDDADRTSLDGCTEANRWRYMTQRWGETGRLVAKMLYQPPAVDGVQDPAVTLELSCPAG